MKNSLVLLLLSVSFLCSAANQNTNAVHFRFDTPAPMQNVLLTAFHSFWRTLPADMRPQRFSVGKAEKNSPAPLLEIAADLPETEMPYAASGIIFAVSRQNPVSKISRIQADSILAGKLTHWEDNGKKQPILLCIYAPTPQVVPYVDQHKNTFQRKTYFHDLELLIRHVNASPNAIAILPVRCFNIQELKLLAPDNIPCTMKQVMKGKYPYANIYRIRWNKKDPLANKLAEYLLSPRTKLRLHHNGDMPLRPNL